MNLSLGAVVFLCASLTTTAFDVQQNRFVIKVDNGPNNQGHGDQFTEFGGNNARSLLNRLPVPSSNQHAPQQSVDPYEEQRVQHRYFFFPAPIILFENQIRQLIIEGRLSSGQNSTGDDPVDLRNDLFVDRNVAELLTSINHFDDLISRSKYSNEQPSANDNLTTTTTSAIN